MIRLFFVLFFSVTALAQPYLTDDVDFESWIQAEQKISVTRMMMNVSPAGTTPGTVVASPSRDNPNYYFHWVRDASLTMNTVVTLAEHATGAEQQKYIEAIHAFARLSQQQQALSTPYGLGDPRFNVDGSIDTIPWGRPQSDGPALRALTLIHFLNSFPSSPMMGDIISVVYADLDYVSKNWFLKSIDLWEERRGFHFYTQSVQYAALKSGAVFFSSEEFLQAAESMQSDLANYWDAGRGYIGASHDLEQDPNSSYKNANLDTAALLGVLHSGNFFGFYKLADDKVIQTASGLENMFRRIYKIDPFAIGRFEDDVYFGGNPWYMTTAAMAEACYNFAAAVPDYQRQQWISKGDAYLKTIRLYVGSQGEMSEQFDRDSGVPVSARDLTWSYAGFLSAVEARSKLLH